MNWILLIVIQTICVVGLIREMIISKRELRYWGKENIASLIKLTISVVMLILIIITYRSTPFKNSLKSSLEINSLQQLIKDMYQNNPSQLKDQLTPYKDMFTEKGYVSIDGADNVLNIINRYTKYSNEHNKVEILKVSANENTIFIMFSITDLSGNGVIKLGEFSKSVQGYERYKEYDLIDVNKK